MDDVQELSKLGADVMMQIERGGQSIVAKDNSEAQRKTDVLIAEIDTTQIDSSANNEELHGELFQKYIHITIFKNIYILRLLL